MIKKNKNRKFFTGLFLTPYFFTLVCLVLIAVIIMPIYKNARQRFAVNVEIADLQKQIASLESSNNDLSKLEVYLKSEQFAEKEARLNMGLKKPGERVAVIENSAANAAGPMTDGSGDTDKNSSNLMNWWNYFFGR